MKENPTLVKTNLLANISYEIFVRTLKKLTISLVKLTKLEDLERDDEDASLTVSEPVIAYKFC